MFTTDLSPFQAVGPAVQRAGLRRLPQRPRAGRDGHHAPDTFVTRVGRIDGGMFDPLDRPGRARSRAPTRSPSSGSAAACRPGVPAAANVTSKRSAMTLRGTALIDFVQTSDILAAQAAQPADVRGKLNVLADGRIGKFGWKAQIATLDRVHGRRLHPRDGDDQPAVPHRRGPRLRVGLPDAGDRRPAVADRRRLPGHGRSGRAGRRPAWARRARPPSRRSAARAATRLRCRARAAPSTSTRTSWCTTWDRRWPTSSWPVRRRGSEWRTAPLWRPSERAHFLHDGRAATVGDAIAAHGGQAAAARGGLRRAGPGHPASAAGVPGLHLSSIVRSRCAV